VKPAAAWKTSKLFSTKVATCLVAVGSNLGNREQTLDRAVEVLTRQEQLRLLRRSRWRETSPVGGPPGQGKFLNGALLLETSLAPQRLIEVLQAVEAGFGRDRRQRWGPRSLDLDLLLYDGLILDTPQLAVPHPRMAWRRFVLEPAAEIAGSMLHPTLGWSVARLWEHLNTAAPYLAIAGPPAAGKTGLARQVGQEIGARLILDPSAIRRRPAALGPSLDAELRILDRRAEPLHAQRPAWSDRTRWSVSDFWLPQSLAYAGVELPAEQRPVFQSHWEQRNRTVVAPKLTVLLDPPAQGSSHLEQVRRAIVAQASRPGQGPVLHLASSASPDAFAEVLAAIESMR
jgi:2-amino-4-hydroxy-6-hydroxymethyldihydropteridine diphosphokinase